MTGTAVATDTKLIRRTLGAGFLVRGALRREVEHYLFSSGLAYTPLREIKSLLVSEYLVEF